MIRIVVDSTSDIPADLRATHRITVVPVLLIRDGETLRDEIDISRDAFYEWLGATERLPSTSAPSVGMFAEQFRALATAGDQIVSISLAGNLSATYTSACQAADLVRSELPDARIACVDSASIGMPLSFLAIAAAEAAAAGQSTEQIVMLLETLRRRSRVVIALDTLRYLQMGGRVSKVKAWLGSTLNVKPVLEVRDGEIRSIEQVRTWKRVPGRLIELARERGRWAELSVQYTSDGGAAEQLADLCAEAGLIERERIQVVQIGAVLGTHVGPGGLGITGLLAE